MNAEEVEERIFSALDDLTVAEESFDTACSVAASAEARYRARRAKSYVRFRDSGQTVADAEARALISVEVEMHDHLMASALVDSGRAAIATIRTRLDVLRTLAASARSPI